jgi:hypothetical protein
MSKRPAATIALACLAAAASGVHRLARRSGATGDEECTALPGDDLVAKP